MRLSAQTGGLEQNESYQKRNGFQYISYKPAAAKHGRDGKDRFFVIQLIKGPKSGKAGKDGAPGPDLKIYVDALKLADSAILRVIVYLTRKVPLADTFYVNPRYGQIKIASDGGDGGSGGKGEDGGGSNGSNGNGGNGGSIDVVISKAAQVFVKYDCFIFSNEGGQGGWQDYNSDRRGSTGKNGLPVYFKDEEGKVLYIYQDPYRK